MARTTIPKKLRKEMETDPEYKLCMLYGHHSHICGGNRKTKEHAVIVGGRTCQKRWAIISVCPRGQDVDEFQDSHSMVKELNEWVAYCRATDTDLLDLCGDLPIADPRLSKAKLHFQRKAFLIGKYGVWEQKIDWGILDRKDTPHIETSEVNGERMNVLVKALNIAIRNPPKIKKAFIKPFSTIKSNWFKVEQEDMKLIKDIQDYINDQEDYHMPYPDVIRTAIKKMHDAVMELKNNVQM